MPASGSPCGSSGTISPSRIAPCDGLGPPGDGLDQVGESALDGVERAREQGDAGPIVGDAVEVGVAGVGGDVSLGADAVELVLDRDGRRDLTAHLVGEGSLV